MDSYRHALATTDDAALDVRPSCPAIAASGHRGYAPWSHGAQRPGFTTRSRGRSQVMAGTSPWSWS